MLIHSAVSDGGTLPNFRMKIATVMSHTAQMSVSGNQLYKLGTFFTDNWHMFGGIRPVEPCFEGSAVLASKTEEDLRLARFQIRTHAVIFTGV